MRMWVHHINTFKLSIRVKLQPGATVEETEFNQDVSDWNRLSFLDISFESFRIFEFVDDTGFRTTAPAW